VFVEWQNENYGFSLVDEQDIIILNRSLALGDSVKSYEDDVMLGTVVDVIETYTLCPNVSQRVFIGNTDLYEAYHKRKAIEQVDSSKLPGLQPPLTHPRPADLLYNIPGEELQRVSDFEDGDYIMFRDWLGVVEHTDVDVVLLLLDDSIVIVEDPFDLEFILTCSKPLVSLPNIGDARRSDFAVANHDIISVPCQKFERGQRVFTHSANIRKGRWLRGKYEKQSASGWILEVRTKGLDVQWLCPNAAGNPRNENYFPKSQISPYENLSTFKTGRDLRLNKDIRLYDRGRRPSGKNNQKRIISTGQAPEAGFRCRFRDPAGAAVKYSGLANQDHGRFVRLPRSETYGFDLNEFEIISSRQEVVVQWQDQTLSRLSSSSLRPFSLPEADLCPGDLVTLKTDLRQLAPGPGNIETEFNEMQYLQGDYCLTPRRIGVVQAVDSRERLVRLRWFLNPDVDIFRQGNVVRAGSALGALSDEYEEVSLYEIMLHPVLLRKRLDLVAIPPERPKFAPLAPMTAPQDKAFGASLLSFFAHASPRWRWKQMVNAARVVLQKTPPSLRPSQNTESKGSFDWVGEVVDVGLDGVLTVRLGAETECRDVKVPFERILMIIDDEASWHDDPGYMANPNLWSASWDLEDDEYSAIDEEVEYEGGERLDEDSGDEMWEDVSEYKNVDMPNAPQLGQLLTDGADEVAEIIEAEQTIQTLRSPASTDIDLSNGRTQLKSNFDWNSLLGNVERPPSFLVLDEPPPDQYIFENSTTGFSQTFLRRIHHEHRILSSSLPADSIYVRTYESRLDLIRCLIVGPADTPYEFAPFVIDLQLGSKFPNAPPKAHFHSWTGGLGRINPNLYEEGKICLSLLGTWPGQYETEGWSQNASILQVLVSLMGLVLVKQPFYNEAGFETYGEEKIYTLESQQYSEKVYVMARGFVKHALVSPAKGLEDVLAWIYLPLGDREGAEATPETEHGLGLLRKTIDKSKALIARSANFGKTVEVLVDGGGESGDATKVFLKPLSRGAVVMLQKHISALEDISESLNRVGGEIMNMI
jgi:ubiquitin-conjugating enzyme E2 O